MPNATDLSRRSSDLDFPHSDRLINEKEHGAIYDDHYLRLRHYANKRGLQASDVEIQKLFGASGWQFRRSCS
jgi:hypothetical protein